MKISIITAIFNREHTIARALNSVNDQTYKSIEKIIIDGCSTDNSVKIASPLLNKNDILISETDNGIYDALNKGIKISKGDIIAFLHSDDFYEDKEVINNVMNIFLAEDVDIVYGNVTFFHRNNPDKIIRNYRSDKLSKKNLSWGKMPAHTAMFIKKKVYDKIGYFNPKYTIAGDYDFLCKLVMNYEFKSVFLDKNLVRMQFGGASTQGIRSLFILNKETYKAILSNGIYTNIFMLLSKYFSKIKQLF